MPSTANNHCRSCGMNGEITATMLRKAAEVACEHGAQGLLVCGGSIPETELLSIETSLKTVFLLTGESGATTANRHQHVIRAPFVPPTRMSQIRMGVLLALSRRLLQPEDTVVCVSGLAGSGVLDSIVAMRIGEEFSMFVGPDRAQWEASDVRPDVLQRVIELATELSIEGREGNPVGALFVLGEIPSVLPRTHQMVLNPFQGYPPDQRNILSGELGETIKEFSTIDGAFLIRGDGAIVSAGTHIDSSVIASAHLPSGLGARHRAAAAITAVTNSVAIALSQSTGTVTIFRRGRMAAELPRPSGASQQRATSNLRPADGDRRILIIGGGVGGLSIALRLAEMHLPVTVLEAGKLGSGATTRNQGWLWSGAWIAREQPELARMFHAALQRTLAVSPGSIEPNTGRMLYLFTNPATRIHEWTDAWRAVGIPCDPVPIPEVARELPNINLERIRAGFRLPDRSIRADVFLNQMAVAARQAGAEIRIETPVVQLLRADGLATGVITAGGETILARGIIFATGSAEHGLLSPEIQSVTYGAVQAPLGFFKSHLLAIRPGIGRTPFCLADQEGFNHLPHGGLSVFGSNNWISAENLSDATVVPEKIESLWKTIHDLFPSLRREDVTAIDWAGTTVQKLRSGQDPPYEMLGPSVVEHPPLQNVLSALAGRATLWPVLAEQARQAVLARVNTTPVAAPPWAEFAAR